jgi:hypothetical protein
LKNNLSKVQASSNLKSVNRHCCVANTHALDHKTLNAHAQIRKTDLNPGLDKPGQEKNMKCAKAGLK